MIKNNFIFTSFNSDERLFNKHLVEYLLKIFLVLLHNNTNVLSNLIRYK